MKRMKERKTRVEETGKMEVEKRKNERKKRM